MSSGEQLTWEYRIATGLAEQDLNALGLESWELVSVADGTFYLKRPRLPFRERVTLDQKLHYYAERDAAAKDDSTT